MIARMGQADLFGPYPVQDTVPIELVQLNLVSVQPITVTFNGGMNPQQWNVELNKSNFAPSQGTMTITKTGASGGTFTSSLTMQPLFIFTRVSPPATLQWQPPTAQPFAVSSASTPWEHACTLSDAIQAMDFCRGAATGPDRVGELTIGVRSEITLYHACTEDDSDTVPDCEDNCPDDSNPLQQDNDSDGTGDVCDATPDGDIPAGNIYLETIDPTNFEFDPPVPSGFFDPGSDPFTGFFLPTAGPLLCPSAPPTRSLNV